MSDPIGTLFIHFYDYDGDLPDGEKVDEAYSVGFSVRCNHGKKRFTEDDLQPEDPKVFLEQGIVMAMMEQIIAGLTSARGISIPESAEKAAEKISSAETAISYDNMREILQEVALSAVKPEGEC